MKFAWVRPLPPLPRLPEVLPDEAEAEADASMEALRCLEAFDDAFVERALAMGIDSGLVLDVGTGSAQIPIKLARRNPSLLIHGIDLSDAMLRRAALDAGRWGVEMRLLLNRGDAKNIPYDPGLFDMVLCSSVLHRVSDPILLIREMERVCKPEGALLLRDLRRPGLLAFALHLRRHGRHFEGGLRRLFEASLRSAYTVRELRRLVEESGVSGLSVGRMGPAHIGFERKPRVTGKNG